MINLKILTNEELAVLISHAMHEWAMREHTVVTQIKTISAAQAKEPDQLEKEYALRIITMFKKGKYIKAGERQQIAEIYEKYPTWCSRQGFPPGSNAGNWKRAAGYSSIPPAKER